MNHMVFNGRPDLSQPIDAQGGDNLDDAAYLFRLLLEDASEQGLDEDEFYFLEDHMMSFFVRVQGCEFLLDAVAMGSISRLRMAYEIWRRSAECVLQDLIEANMGDWGEDELFISI